MDDGVMLSPDRAGLVAKAGAVGVAVGVFGVSFGVLAVSSGLSPAMTVGMSLLVFAGGAQFAALGIIAAGGSPWAAIVPGLLLNTRFVPMGVAVAPVLGRTGPWRFLATLLVIDETVAFALAEPDPASARRAFWSTGVVLVFAWNVGTLLGAVAGTAIEDPAVYGLDAAFPAGFLALLAPLVRTRRQRTAAAAGALLAVATTPLLPLGLPIVVAALGALAGLAVPERPGPAEGAARPGSAPSQGGAAGPGGPS